LKALSNVKHAPACDALLVVCPEHHRTFRLAGWSKARLYEELYRLCEIPGATSSPAPRASPEAARFPRQQDRQQIPSGRDYDRPRRRRRRYVLRHHRRLSVGGPAAACR